MPAASWMSNHSVGIASVAPTDKSIFFAAGMDDQLVVSADHEFPQRRDVDFLGIDDGQHLFAGDLHQAEVREISEFRHEFRIKGNGFGGLQTLADGCEFLRSLDKIVLHSRQTFCDSRRESDHSTPRGIELGTIGR